MHFIFLLFFGGGVKKRFHTEIIDHANFKGISVRETARVRVRAANISASTDRPPGFGKGVKTLEKTFTTESDILSPWSHTWLDPSIGEERQRWLSAYGNHYKQTKDCGTPNLLWDGGGGLCSAILYFSPAS